MVGSSWLRAGIAVLLLAGRAATYQTLSDDTLRKLPAGGADFDVNHGALLAPILIPRVPGTAGSAAVREHFVHFFRTQLPDWTITTQNSTSKTPVTGDADVPFTNLIFSRDPPWAHPGNVGRLTLVAHYDSKLHPEGFIGATDSAAPCAILLHAARSINEALTRKWAAVEASGAAADILGGEVGVQILLLDGEEAFDSWSDTDSLYGARSLAASWESTMHPALSTYHTALSSISLFVLLDLLGAPNPRVPSFFKTTHWAYQRLAQLETRMRDLSILQTDAKHPFLPDAGRTDKFMGLAVADDHMPFVQRGVEVLHLIPTPFPLVWHTMDDDGAHLDLATVEDWARIITAFAGEWMELEGYIPDAPPAKATRKTEL